MISDLMPVHRAFMTRFEEHQVRGTVVVPKFFNAQPKLKEEPTFPALIVTVFVPQFGPFHWVHGADVVNSISGTITTYEPPKDVILKYQVDARANRFDDINDLYLWLNNAIEQSEGSLYLQVGDDTVGVEITDTREVPDLDMGVFQWSFTYDVRVALFNLSAEPQTLISDFALAVKDVAKDQPLT